MGNSQTSSSQSGEFAAASRTFLQTELDSLKKSFDSLTAQSKSQGNYLSASEFQDHFGIKGALGARLFDVVTRMRKDDHLLFEDLVIAKATLENGSPSEIEDFMFELLDLTGDGNVQRSELETVIQSILETVRGPKDSAEAGSSEDCPDAFLNSAEFSLKVESEQEECMSKQDFRKLCTLVPSIKKFLSTLLSPPTAGLAVRQVPQLVDQEGTGHVTLLKTEHAWHISGPLQHPELQEWALVYHSSIHGLSFNSFLNRISAVQGPTVLVVKDKEGCIYGGYASQPWERHSDFFGDMKCFLFSLHPQISLYRPTGSNTNLQWCASNYVSESIPNGIGFGGQIHHFGLFLSASFDKGHTRYSVTFGNPALSTQGAVIPDTIECWAVVTKGSDGRGLDDSSKGKGTILERFKEDRQMLNLVGIANASDSAD